MSLTAYWEDEENEEFIPIVECECFYDVEFEPAYRDYSMLFHALDSNFNPESYKPYIGECLNCGEQYVQDKDCRWPGWWSIKQVQPEPYVYMGG
ncbi:hypothetical protein LCGC14_0728240 [marine sediment metagenome]|uniref:Uncharacterized protein n=1 Tax=marine sediment metagenome TaxID=412755 RepID=A0A0F9QEI9_9ZZZZ